MKFDIRYSNHPEDSKHYDTATLRKHYLIEKVFIADEIALTYSHQDRIIAGGAMPVSGDLVLGTTKELATDYFLERREMGVINIGMSIMGIDQNYQKVVKGAVLRAAVIFDVVSKKNDSK